MKWSFRICEINGTQVRVHVTFFLLLIWFGGYYLLHQGAGAAVSAVIFILALFTCVVLHEFGHVTAAKYFGVRTPDITLLPIGGVARLERIPRKPYQELVIAVCGPLVNVFIASVLFLILGGFPDLQLGFNIASLKTLLPNLMVINIWLVLFNLIPAFPMDGGRMFRALLAMVFGYTRATQTAASLGQVLALVGGLLGILTYNPFLILIAIFIFMGAGQEAALVRIQEATSGLSVSDAMITEFRSLPLHDTIQDAVDSLIAGTQHDFPVLNEDGSLAGILLRKDLIASLAEHGRAHPIRDIIHPSPPFVRLNCSLEKAFETLTSSPCSTLPVIENDGHALAGIITTENVGEMIMVQSALASRRKTRGPAADASEPAVA